MALINHFKWQVPTNEQLEPFQKCHPQGIWSGDVTNQMLGYQFQQTNNLYLLYIKYQMTSSNKWTPRAASSNKWTPRAASSNKWTPPAASSNKWTPQATSSNKWASQATSSNEWTPQTTNSNKWTSRATSSNKWTSQATSSNQWAPQATSSNKWTSQTASSRMLPSSDKRTSSQLAGPNQQTSCIFHYQISNDNQQVLTKEHCVFTITVFSINKFQQTNILHLPFYYYHVSSDKF